MSNSPSSSNKSAVILGATSAVARAAAAELARHGYSLVLGARAQDENDTIAADLRVRFNATVHALPFSAEDYDTHPAFLDTCRELLGDIDGVVLCFGYLEQQTVAQQDFVVARRTVDVNYTAAVSILELFAKHFEERQAGFIAIVSSVAGDRGRQSNYIYGSSKAAVSAYAQGLRNRLYHAGVNVITIKPGFIDTKMTFGLPNLLLVASPETVGRDIWNAIGKQKQIIYTPWFWRYIMLIVKTIPETIFKRLKM